MVEDTVKTAEQMVELLEELVEELSPEGRKKLGEVIKRNAVIVSDNIVLCDKNIALCNALRMFVDMEKIWVYENGPEYVIQEKVFDAAQTIAEELLPVKETKNDCRK